MSDLRPTHDQKMAFVGEKSECSISPNSAYSGFLRKVFFSAKVHEKFFSEKLKSAKITFAKVKIFFPGRISKKALRTIWFWNQAVPKIQKYRGVRW
jgi:hypothetical protein